jgi:protein O-mannosyl-transferase
MDTAKQTPWAIFVGALLSALTLVTFWPLAHADFVNYDDTAYVTENAHVLAGLTLANIRWAFCSTCLGNWHPLAVLAHMLDVQLFGLDAGWHHVTSLALHVANTLLLFGLLRRMTGRLWPSAFVAALFALHPLHVESVAWISERKDVLSTFFALLSLWAYNAYARSRRQKAEAQGSHPGGWFAAAPAALYALCLGLFGLSLMSKAMFVTLPGLMLLLDYWPLGRLKLRPESSSFKSALPFLLEKLPFFALSVAATCTSVLLISATGATQEVAAVGLGERVGRAFAAYQHYLAKTLWPAGLAMPYLRPQHWPAWEVGVAAVIVGILTLGALRQSRRRPWLIVGWLWFLGMLVPVIGLVPVGAHAMADRYTYFPLVGLFVAVTWSATEVADRGNLARVVLGALAGVILLGGMVITRAQVGCWQNSETLFRHAIAVTRDNFIAYTGLGMHSFSQGQVDEAIRHYEDALRINPRYDVAHSHLGRALAQRGRYDGAVSHFEAALSLRPDDAKTRNNYGGVLLLQGRYEQAVRQFEEVVRLQREHAAAHSNLALSYRKLGRLSEAITHYRESMRLQPDSPEPLNNLAWLMATCPDPQYRNGAEAVVLATWACELTRYQSAASLLALAAAYAETGQFREAISFAERAQSLPQPLPPAMATQLERMLAAFHSRRAYHAD